MARQAERHGVTVAFIAHAIKGVRFPRSALSEFSGAASEFRVSLAPPAAAAVMNHAPRDASAAARAATDTDAPAKPAPP